MLGKKSQYMRERESVSLQKEEIEEVIKNGNSMV